MSIVEKIKSKLLSILANYLEVDKNEIAINMSRTLKDFDVDSIEIVDLVFKINREFNIMLLTEQIKLEDSAADLLDCVLLEMLKKRLIVREEIASSPILSNLYHILSENQRESFKKPPLGIMPEFYFERSRIQDLCRAISEYVGECRQTPKLKVWSEELSERVSKYNKLNKHFLFKEGD